VTPRSLFHQTFWLDFRVVFQSLVRKLRTLGMELSKESKI